jgi:lysophospholipase L1-like esterase
MKRSTLATIGLLAVLPLTVVAGSALDAAHSSVAGSAVRFAASASCNSGSGNSGSGNSGSGNSGSGNSGSGNSGSGNSGSGNSGSGNSGSGNSGSGNSGSGNSGSGNSGSGNSGGGNSGSGNSGGGNSGSGNSGTGNSGMGNAAVVLAGDQCGKVLGLGDSVAAGYGLGDSDGYPDNPGAYSAIIGMRLGDDVKNYAIQGACSSSSVPGCASSVAEEIGDISSGFNPSIITVTVGANDIDFGDCLKSMIADSDLTLTASTDPCNNASLTASLATLQTNLTSDLQTLSTDYPHATIYVMNYYNPFPPSPRSNPKAVCVVDKAITLLYEHAKLKSWLKAVRLYADDQGQFTRDAEFVQYMIYEDSMSILNRLNSTINSAAAGLATVFNTDDFAGHDICARKKWVFAPTLSVTMFFNVGPVSVSVTPLSYGGDACPDPVGPSDWNVEVDTEFGATIHHVDFSGEIDFSMGVNCMPHPNAAGQKAIASDFLHQTGH